MDVSFECPCCGKMLRGRMPKKARVLKCPNCLMEVQPSALRREKSARTTTRNSSSPRKPSADSGAKKKRPRRLPVAVTPLVLGLAFAGGAFLVFAHGSPREAASGTTTPEPDTLAGRESAETSSSATNTETPQRSLPRRTPVEQQHVWSGSRDQTESARGAKPDEKPERLREIAQAEARPTRSEPASTAPGITKVATTAQRSSEVPSWPRLERVTRNVRFPAPQLSDASVDEVHATIWPTDREMKWRNIRWHTELEDAQDEARKLQRPILLWTMNGHPCGET